MPENKYPELDHKFIDRLATPGEGDEKHLLRIIAHLLVDIKLNISHNANAINKLRARIEERIPGKQK